MIVGSSKPKPSSQVQKKEAEAAESDESIIESYLSARDYTAVSTYIEFIRHDLLKPYTKELALWHGYSLFHQGLYSDAIAIYESLLKEDPTDPRLNLYIACCHFYNGDYEAAHSSILKGPSSDLKSRLQFLIALKTGNQDEFNEAQSSLSGTPENQLALAAVRFMRSDFQEALSIYQRILLQHPDWIALNVYISMCQFKLDLFEESNDSVDLYLSTNSDSAVALNVKSCDYLRIHDHLVAESQILQIKKFSSASYSFINNLVDHNLCIFHGDEEGFTVFPRLIQSIPEARFNLIVLYMRNEDAEEASNLLPDFQAKDPNEKILKATVKLELGQQRSDPNLILEANEIFSEIGGMEIVKDTVPGRECLAATKFINGEYSEALKVLQTVEHIVGDADEYLFNKAMTYAALSMWDDAEQCFLKIQNSAYKREVSYLTWLSKCYIQSKKASEAWNLYVDATSTEIATTLLQIISTDCYLTEQYYYAMKAYDILSKSGGDPTEKQGLIASAVGVFKGVVSGEIEVEKLQEVVSVLASEPDASQVLQVIQNYVEGPGEKIE